MLEIIIDADGCPVKEEVYRVAIRYGLKVTLVSNSRMRIPNEEWVQFKLVENHLNAADDWIAENITENDIVISGDIPLASRCLKKGAKALDPRGRVFTPDSIGDALANRELFSALRELGTMSGGPAPFEKQDRSRFLQRLNEIIHAIQRGKK
ncbi:MAG: YaiI/YqxD family protein [Planctomycetota bacterium]